MTGNEVGKNRGHGNTMARNEVWRNEGLRNAVARNVVGSSGGQCNAVARHDVGKNEDHGITMTRHEVEKNGSKVDAAPQCDDVDEGQGVADTGRLELATSSAEPIQTFEIASSPLGEVKINLSLNFANRPPGFQAPSVEDVLKRMENKCMQSYKIVDPNFSLMNLMKEMCQCFLQLGSSAAEDKVENHIKSTETSKCLEHRSNLDMPASPIVSLSSDSLHKMFGTNIPKVLPFNNLGDRKIVLNMPNVPRELAQSYSPSLVPVHQNKSNHDGTQPLHNVADISKGEEMVKITVINEGNSWPYPSKFYYIPQNIVYQSAYVDFSLARIGDENCCMNCFSDCLASSIPCACARETGGEFAYTSEGLLKQEFLDRCVSMKHNPQKDHFFYCKVCPLERSRNEDIIDPCQGHLVRKFIKECWSKCGCGKYCGNRVVQRGINKSLQVFFTQEGKGWGLRTLEFLPKGTFVCEYVGEILTNIELYERNTRRSGNEEHTYPVLLDADWGSEGILKDEEALCLDATSYGNVARFINHRCHDANLVEIPVEIESPDHHYYHLAFFTTRNVEPLEELCWDYEIDFEDQNHPIKAFTCKCGSNGCRDKRIRPRKRSKQAPLVLR
ncbi:hypothetical protein Syun_030173 [Stephania yunnanensis]|uniref:Uncharacterized protein n=1 Tax=Stephania yunnanensis TaxID=152371 RepID=A0AAP0HHZ6_9MAGN